MSPPREPPGEARRKAAEGVCGRAESIIAALFGPGVNSDSRLPLFLELTAGEPSETFWKVFAAVWDSCDATGPWQEGLAAALADHCRRADFRLALSPSDAAWLSALPDRVRIYRGGDRHAIRGLSWTTARHVAEGFARGHRGIRVVEPVIASGFIAKRDILFATNGREEAEVLAPLEKTEGLTLEEHK